MHYLAPHVCTHPSPPQSNQKLTLRLGGESAFHCPSSVERHLSEARLPPGKTLENFDFATVPMLSKARVMALADGDAWHEKAANLLLFGPPGAGKSQCNTSIGRALV